MNTVALKFGVVVAVLGMAGCARTTYVMVPTPPSPPAGALLQACTDHAAKAQRGAFGHEFRGLQFNTAQAVLAAPLQPVGTQPVGAVYDGEGVWFGQPQGAMGVWRKVRYHCMLNPAGQVVYSFVRGY